MNDCLVIDGSSRPIGFCHWQSAVKLLWEDVATVVKEDRKGRTLNSPSISIGFPRVIKVKGYVAKQLRRNFIPNKRNIATRDRNECQYCWVFLHAGEQTLDHIIPRSKGGKGTWENLVLSCKPCNWFKGDRTPKEAGMVLLSIPCKPNEINYSVSQIRPEWEDWRGMGLF